MKILIYQQPIYIYTGNDEIDGYVYVLPERGIDLRAEGCDKFVRTSTNNAVKFEYDALKPWIEGSVDITDNNFECRLKADIRLGSTAKIIIKSAEYPSITKELTFKVSSKEEVKKMFLDAVKSLPSADKITYDHYEIIEKAIILGYYQDSDTKKEQEIIDAFEKLSECEDAYYALPTRFFYSINGSSCIFSNNEDGTEWLELDFVSNGPFPQGTYTVKYWECDEDDSWYQSRLNLKASNILTIEVRCANNPEGNNPTEWMVEGKGTYKIEGNDKKGVLYITWQEGDSTSPISASKCTSKNNKTKKIRAFATR